MERCINDGTNIKLERSPDSTASFSILYTSTNCARGDGGLDDEDEDEELAMGVCSTGDTNVNSTGQQRQLNIRDDHLLGNEMGGGFGNGGDTDDSLDTGGYVGEDSYAASSPMRDGESLGADSFALDGQRRLCLVCNDLASGLHYGVASCEACKAFFKRTVQGNIDYTCPANGECEITKRRRKACQACRYQKCITVGMLKEGVRIDRVRGGRQKYRQRSADGLTFSTYSWPLNGLGASENQSTRENRLDNTSLATNSSSGLASYIDSEKKTVVDSSVISVCQQLLRTDDSNQLLTTLYTIEPEKVYAMPDPSLPTNHYKFMITMSDLSDRELVATIGWAKQVPGFLGLPLTDQMNLLQSTWLDVLCLNLAYRSMPYRNVLVYADDFRCSEDDSAKLEVPSDLDSITRRLSMKMSELVVTREEYMLMKAMLLFNPDLNVKNPSLVQALRDRVLDALAQYECGRGQNSHRRLCNLMFVFPLLAQQRLLTIEFWVDVRKSGSIVLHKLLSEMLEYMSC